MSHLSKNTGFDLRKYVGDMSQIAGMKSYQLLEGKSKGVRAVDFWTGTGLNFTVVLDRGMDISRASYKGSSLCWRSCTGEIHPYSFESQGAGWLRGFFGGLLTTCGLTYLGAPCIDQGEHLGLHGRISYIPAENIQMNQEWEGEDYVMSLSGQMRQSCVFGENLVLKRKIIAWLGRSEILLEDVVENDGFKESPFMILYHINIGFPLLSPGSKFVSPSVKIAPRDSEAEEDIEKFNEVEMPPLSGYREKVYYHEMKADENGMVRCAVLAENASEEPYGLYVIYNKNQLPRFVQWKMLGEQNYVLGIEPSNCWTEGRDKEREWGTLEFIKKGEKRKFTLRLGVLSNKIEVERFIKDVQKIVGEEQSHIVSKMDMLRKK